MNTMLTRLVTSLLLILIIFLIIYLENIWIFSLSISFVCIIGISEWVRNKFENLFLGLFLIFGFGSCSILYVFLNESFYLLYGLIIMNTAIFDTFAYVIGTKFGTNFIVKKISPNKTYSGLIGSYLLSLTFSLTLFYDYSSINKIIIS